MKLENMNRDFPKMPEEMRQMIEQEVESSWQNRICFPEIEKPDAIFQRNGWPSLWQRPHWPLVLQYLQGFSMA